MMNDPSPKTEQKFREEDIIFYDRKKVLDELHKYKVFTLVDSQASSTKKSDWDVVVTVAVKRDHVDGGGVIDRWYILEMDYGKRELPEKLNSFFSAKRQYNTYAFGIEDVGFQKIIVQETKRALETKPYSEQFIVKGITTGGVPKPDRIMGLLKYFRNGIIHIPNDMPTWYVEHFLPEMRHYHPTKENKHDDGLDALAMLPVMLDEFGYNSYSYKVNHGFDEIDIESLKKNPLIF